MRFPYRPYLIYEPGYILGAIFVSWLVGLPVILPLALIAGVFWKKSAYKTKTPPIIEDIFIWPQTAERGTRKQFKIPVRRAGNIGKVEQLYTLDIPPGTKSAITITFPNQGNQTKGKLDGDVVFKIHVLNKDFFKYSFAILFFTFISVIFLLHFLLIIYNKVLWIWPGLMNVK